MNTSMEKGNRCIYSKGRSQFCINTQNQLDNWVGHAQDRDLMYRWQNRLFSQGSKELRVAKLTSQLMKLVKQLPSPIKQATRTDIEQVICWINRQTKWSDCTQADYRRCLKQFYSWLLDDYLEDLTKPQQGLLKEVKRIKANFKHIRRKHSEIITEADINEVIQKGTSDALEQAFLAVLHESGFRAGEMLNIKLKDIITKGQSLEVCVDGKTGVRSVDLFVSVGYLRRYLTVHPQRNNQESYLWIGRNRTIGKKPLNHIGASKLVKNCFKRANVPKRCNLHWFRHSRATINGEFMAEPLMCLFFGWSPTSDQPRNYCHAGKKQLTNQLKAMRGIESEDSKKIVSLQCSTCHTHNPSDNKFCTNCGTPLTVQAAQQKTDYMNEALSAMSKIMEDPALFKQFQDFKQKKLQDCG